MLNRTAAVLNTKSPANLPQNSEYSFDTKSLTSNRIDQGPSPAVFTKLNAYSSCGVILR